MNKPKGTKNGDNTKNVRVAIAQVNTIVGDFKYNSRLIASYLGKAQKAQVDIILFPELSLTGYPPEDLLLKKDFVIENQKQLKSLIIKTKNITALIGYAEKNKDGLYNSMAVISNGKLVDSYRKMVLPNYGVFDEHRYFKAGSTPCRLVKNGIVYALSICEDLWVEDGPAKILCSEGDADIILNISASPFYKGKDKKRLGMIRERAKKYKATVVWANLIGGQDELLFDGHSLIVSPDGSIMARGNAFEEELLVLDIPIKKPKSIKRKKQLSKNRKIKTLKVSNSPIGNKIAKRQLPSHIYRKKSDLEMIYEGLIMGTRDYMGKNAFQKAVIGLSGGIDSALTAVVATEALGAGNVVGVLMPSPYSSKGSIKDSIKLAKNLDIETITLPIQNTMEAFSKSLADNFEGTPSGIAEENLQARIRGNLLMALSNKHGWLVLTTGNKSEISVGYCTLYGDMAGGFSIIKDVPKTMVFELSEFINKQNKADTIPREIIEKEPSAELRPDQKDSDSLPDYSRLDAILSAYIEEDKGMDDLLKMGFNKKEIMQVTRMVDQNEYKRRQGAPGIKITPKAFGKDRRLPITNHYKFKVK
ncbi:MAG: NAD+ synthase [Nitrospinales bacterium]